MKNILYTEAVSEAIAEEMRRDESVFIMGEDVGLQGNVFGCCKGLFREFGAERVRDTPISEAAIVGAGLGAAMTGMRPIVELMFVDFAHCAMDQLLNQVATARYIFGGKVKVPLTICTTQGGYLQNAAHHSQNLEAFFMHTPGLKVVMPSSPFDVKGLLKTAIRDDNPVIFLEHKGLFNMRQAIPEEEYLIPFGKAEIKREGSDATIIATLKAVHMSLNAAKELEKEGISVEVIDLRTLVPLDKETILKSVMKTGRVVVVHESHTICGVGAEIASMITEEAFHHLRAPVMRVGAKHVPIPFSSTLENACLPQVEDIRRAVLSTLGSQDD
ncbi:MAG: alpha-ketoacid dehydrogenase subunit beta [Clostridiales bacterium]|nr:alpha-ketoacid dehydrogenase subunit beta [Clostridiales bacterium]